MDRRNLEKKRQFRKLQKKRKLQRARVSVHAIFKNIVDQFGVYVASYHFVFIPSV